MMVACCDNPQGYELNIHCKACELHPRNLPEFVNKIQLVSPKFRDNSSSGWGPNCLTWINIHNKEQQDENKI